MTTLGLELVDAGLLAVRDGARVAASPGVAVLDPGGLLVGDAAAATMRLQPLLAVDRFWADLATDAWVQAAGMQYSHADIAHAHLAELWGAIATAEDRAAFAVPGSMRLPQLGLVLGIARRIGIPVAGVVDAAVVACAELAARDSVLHLDVELHQAVLTAMRGGSVLRRMRTEIAPRAGLKAMYGAWAHLISESMLRRTRFDPLHDVASEQQLHERLPGWLERFAAEDSIDVAIETGENTFTTTVRREQFPLAADAWYAQLVELVHASARPESPATVALSARAALLPGLKDRLAALPGIEPVVLPDAAAAAAAAARADDIGPGDPPTLVTALARRQPVASGTAPNMRRVGMANPTHVMLESRAHRIDEQPLIVGSGGGESAKVAARRLLLSGSPAGVSRSHCTLLRDGARVIVRDHSRYGSYLNGERVDGEAVLAAGDRLRLGTPGVVLELVAVA